MNDERCMTDKLLRAHIAQCQHELSQAQRAYRAMLDRYAVIDERSPALARARRELQVAQRLVDLAELAEMELS